MSDQPPCRVCGERTSSAASAPAWEPVVCSDCGNPYHRECFEYLGRCASPDCGGLRYSRVAAGERDVTEMVVSKPAEPSADRATRFVLDLDTPAEQLGKGLVLLGATAVGLMVAAWWHRGLVGLRAALGFVLSSASLYAAWRFMRSTDCYYIVDCAQRQIIYHRRIAGRLALVPWTAFDGATRLELIGEPAYRWPNEERGPGYWYTKYRLELVDRRGRRTVLSDVLPNDGSGLAALEQRGWRAAELIGCPLELVERSRLASHSRLLACIALAIAAMTAWQGALGALLGIAALAGAPALTLLIERKTAADRPVPTLTRPSERLLLK